jgi:hypothetical protein
MILNFLRIFYFREGQICDYLIDTADSEMYRPYLISTEIISRIKPTAANATKESVENLSISPATPPPTRTIKPARKSGYLIAFGACFLSFSKKVQL